MEQETAYQEMFRWVAGYRGSEERLELLDAQGAVLAVFERGVF